MVSCCEDFNFSTEFKASYGLLGTTLREFPSSAATKAVLEVIEEENRLQMLKKWRLLGFFASQIKKISKKFRYQGLMIGIDLAFPCNEVRTRLVKEYKMLTGNASTPNTLRVLPALNEKRRCEKFG